MTRRLLDLFCGAGGAAVGYARAGFEVVGVDLVHQPNYPFEFHQDDAFALIEDSGHYGTGWLRDPIGTTFDVVHASPVCYAWSKMRDRRPETRIGQPDQITPLRDLLKLTGLPYVIENVPGSPLPGAIQICGSGLGMTLQRHRWFESNMPLWGVPCAHGQNAWNPAYGHTNDPGRVRRRVPVIGEWRIPIELQREAMGIDWMTLDELTEAIPPAYTEWIGEQLLTHLAATQGASA